MVYVIGYMQHTFKRLSIFTCGWVNKHFFGTLILQKGKFDVINHYGKLKSQNLNIIQGKDVTKLMKRKFIGCNLFIDVRGTWKTF